MHKMNVSEPPSGREVARRSRDGRSLRNYIIAHFLKKYALFYARTLLQSPCGDSVRSLATVALAP